MRKESETYWNECSFKEIDSNILYCSQIEISYPIGTFLSWVPEVKSIKSGMSKGRYQEILVNDEKIFLIKGGCNWKIRYISTLEEKEKKDAEFGRRMLERARKSKTPWHVAKITKEIDSDTEAILFLVKIRQIAKKRNISPEQKYALRSADLEVRDIALNIVLGEDIFNKIRTTIKEYEKLSRYLAYYLAVGGKLQSHDITKECRIPAPIHIGYLEQYEHNIMIRILLASVPRNLAIVTDLIDSNDEAIEVLKGIKKISNTTILSTEQIYSLKSVYDEERNNTLKSILGENIWDKIKEKVINNDDLSYYLGFYIQGKIMTI